MGTFNMINARVNQDPPYQNPHELAVIHRHKFWVERWANTSQEDRIKTYDRLRKYRRGFRDKVLQHYGKHCVCCGETHEEFLTIDHIKGGGSKHRLKIRASLPYMMYRWIIEHDYPKEFQVLCFNCNITKGQYGQCPHERERLVTQ